MQADNPDQVARRRVFYIPGYDPIHPRRYRELYRKEGAAQAAVSGYEMALRPRGGDGGYGWHVKLSTGATTVNADLEVLVWSDIVRASMSHGIGATYLQLLRTARTYIVSGAIFRLARLRKGPTIAALYPIAVLILELAVALLAGSGVVWLVGRALAALGLPEAIGWIAGMAAVWAVLWRFRQADNRIFAYYLMHDYAFTAAAGGANPPALEARMAEFADRIAEALGADWDEVLIVGHSSGAHLAVSILADLIRAGRVRQDGPALGFLSLGQVVPMVAFLPEARRLRADLAYLSARDEITWIDVTAPGDGCAFALCDPVSVTGVAPADKHWPLVVSAAFTQTLSPDRWRALRWRFFRLHFQYLCAFDRPGDYDYFLITAGPLTLAARYRDRAPSKSRIETPLNRYRDVA
ncbi:hypothetical protein DEA8626_01833 [Defluviimonas aquaemixtae]|uniref:Fungal lipase-like domain-containing protein n=1 Tax=Albidovulum aquaemixtae TaxID=1542388 RepID=A0A2R8B6N0_9RHOB|nr:hypothetical protein [Defluviimonas aquaemixtae]SPH18298.1 hypothetical protein DEA8626_01833 [Defluviimonas aquaemixtae]